ncbi:single-strand binding protein [Tenacibaculum sp. MAR_2009_124]|uniref:single-stranded DNA-binding protein n=1 Tax=Tenacibaculum sp. MAR_2009_124 TaxID=1250059 RepID=UPI00089986EB|nr:single-stranded DNA-binding protein [Tenacibaculum sp. MAR_2009_124]SEC49429.1 single-strand binding protein [Tenacibaculum sp. MAR_2009_124]
MAGTVNKVILIGHLGDEVKMHYFEGGNAIGRFPIATNETYTNRQTGERITNTEWHNIVVRNKLAEICEKYLTKGDKVYVEGRLKNRQYEVDGQKRYTTEIQVQDMTFLSTKKDPNTNAAPPQVDQQHSAPNPGNNVSSKLNEDDDLPF